LDVAKNSAHTLGQPVVVGKRIKGTLRYFERWTPFKECSLFDAATAAPSASCRPAHKDRHCSTSCQRRSTAAALQSLGRGEMNRTRGAASESSMAAFLLCSKEEGGAGGPTIWIVTRWAARARGRPTPAARPHAIWSWLGYGQTYGCKI